MSYCHTVILSNCHASNYPFPLNISMKLLDINLYFLYSILVNNMNIKLHFAHEKVISFSLPGLTQDLITFVHCPLNLLTGITPFTLWTLVEREYDCYLLDFSRKGVRLLLTRLQQKGSTIVTYQTLVERENSRSTMRA